MELKKVTTNGREALKKEDGMKVFIAWLFCKARAHSSCFESVPYKLEAVNFFDKEAVSIFLTLDRVLPNFFPRSRWIHCWDNFRFGLKRRESIFGPEFCLESSRIQFLIQALKNQMVKGSWHRRCFKNLCVFWRGKSLKCNVNQRMVKRFCK